MKGKRHVKRVFSFILSAAVVLSALNGLTGMSAWAADGDSADTVSGWYASASDVKEKGANWSVSAEFDLAPMTTPSVYKDNGSTFTDMEGKDAGRPSEMTGYWNLTNESAAVFEPGAPNRSLKFIPKADGIVDAYAKVGAGKTFIIRSVDNAQKVSWKNEDTASAYKKISAPVTAGTSYYIYADGSGSDFFAVVFTKGGKYEEPIKYSWSASADDFNKKAGDSLMTGLTLVSDNSSTNKAYVSAAENGKIETVEGGKRFSGASLQFVAPEDGTLEVTMIDLALTNNPVIYGAVEKADVNTNTDTVQSDPTKKTVVLKATVTKGQTYYITATGTKGRFSAAKFTPQPPAPQSGMTVSGDTVTVTSADVTLTSGILVQARSAQDERFESAKTYPLTFTNGVATAKLVGEVGTYKLMAWKDDTMEPICDPIEYTYTGLPDDIIFRADDKIFDEYASVSTDHDGGTYGKLTIGNKYHIGSKNASYTHTDGKAYSFTRAWQGGTGNATVGAGAERNLSFQPEGACVVTVVFDGNGGVGRAQSIAQGGTVLETAESTDPAIAVVTADILNPADGVVTTFGGGSNKNVYAIFVEYYTAEPDKTITGTIENTTGEDLSNEILVFTNTKDSADVVEVPYSASYAAKLTKGESYKISVKGKEEVICATLDTAQVSVTKNRYEQTHAIKLVKIVDMNVTGEIVTHGLDTSGVTLTFTAKDDASITKTAVISDLTGGTIPTADKALSVTLTPNHEYTVTASGNDGYTLSPLSQTYTMLAGDTEPFKNILFTKNSAPIAFQDTLTVGKGKEYETVSEAVAAIETMTDRPLSETGRVAVVIDPGTYVEQVIVKPDFVTLKAADPDNKPVISFYYGVGYLYYSADRGYYSEDRYVQRTARNTVTNWGCTVRVVGSNFLAENVIFENSLNCRVTAEELADGVLPAGPGWYDDVSGKPDRTVEGYDAQKKAATERCAAFAGNSSSYECYNCEFIGSQDTLNTGNNGYFKNCYIEGGTDYIFGGNSIVFEGCTLAWHGYSDQAAGGYITACNTSDKTSGVPNMNANGYLLKDCTITNSKYYPNNKFAAGSWGRNWGGDKCQVVFQNTTIAEGAAVPGAWNKMGGELSESVLYVDGVKDAAGNTVDVSGTVHNPNGTMAANGYTVMAMTDYFGDWIPKHYEGDLPVVEEKAVNIKLDLTNGKLLTAEEIAEKTQTSFGVTKDGRRVAADSADAMVVLNNIKYHSDEHGVNPGTATITVPSQTKVTVGGCAFGSGIVLKANGTQITSSDNASGCWHNDKSTVVMYYKGETEATLEVSGGGYWPYLAFESVKAEEIPTDVTAAFSIGDSGAAGVVPEAVTVGFGKGITIPANRTLYKEGNTLTGWTDGTNTYAIGDTITLETNVTLTPVFAENTKAVADTTVVFDFQRKNGAPKVGWENTADKFWVGQATIDGTQIDVKMGIDTTSKTLNDGTTGQGKIANANWDDWAQINQCTEFTLPAVVGMTIALDAMGENTKLEIGANQFNKTGSYTVTASDINNGKVTMLNVGGGYTRTITVTYPAAAVTPPGSETLTGTVAVTGTAKVGETLTAAVTGSNAAEFKYQWQANTGADSAYADIEGAASSAYVIDASLAGKTIKCVVTADGFAGLIESAATEAVLSAEGEAPLTSDFTANSKVIDGYSVAVSGTAEEKVHTFAKAAGVGADGAGYSVDLSALLGDNLYSKRGIMTVTMQFQMPDAAKKPSNDGYIDISSSTAYSGKDDTRFVRYNIYNGWDQFNYYGSGETRVNGGVKFSNHTADWYTLTATIDLTSKKSTVVTTAGTENANYTLTEFPAAPVDGKLYINVVPTRSANDANEVEFSVKNISVSYEKAPDVLPSVITTVNYTDDSLKTTKLGGEVSVSAATASAGETIVVTPSAYYGFEVSAVKIVKVTETGSTTEPVAAQDGVYSFVAENGVTEYKVSAEFVPAANKKILYFMDSVIQGSIGKIAVDNDIKLMNYVQNGAATAWAAQDLKLNGKTPAAVKVVLTKNNDPQIQLSLNGADIGGAQELIFDNSTKFKAASKSDFFVAPLSFEGAVFGDSDALKVTITSKSDSNGFIGNYWYMVLEYAE